MEPLTLQIKHPDAIKVLQSLKENQLIEIVREADKDSPALPGEPLSLKAFQDWINRCRK